MFACDLDQTLIYSRNSMGTVEESELIAVERYEDRIISFMTHSALAKLQAISRQMLVVPTTTRTYDQFQRVFALSSSVHCRYAIVSNGGKVVIDGQSDRDWEQQMARTTQALCAAADEVTNVFNRYRSDDWVVKATYCDELFYSININRAKLPDGLIDLLQTSMLELGWICSLQGRKVYLVPQTISKGAAVQYVRELAQASRLIAAGDSLLDESMLLLADQAVAPIHGELYRKYGTHSHIQFTAQTGIQAADEILDIVLNRMEMRTA